MSNQKRSQRKRTEKTLWRRRRRRTETKDLRERIYEAWLGDILDLAEFFSLNDFVDDVLDYGPYSDYELDDPDDWVESDYSEPEEPYAEDLDWWYGWDDY
jgi:hypothetical protein